MKHVETCLVLLSEIVLLEYVLIKSFKCAQTQYQVFKIPIY